MVNPIIVVNVKCYEKATGKDVLAIASACEQTGAWIAAQSTDLYRISSQTGAKVYAQHIDPVGFGSHTGAVTADAVLSAGAEGTLLNHSEKRLSFDVLKSSVMHARNAGLSVIVCAENLSEAKKFDSLQADFIALELPELIGGDVSIVDSDPELIKNAVSSLDTPVLVGAGVHSGEDVRAAMSFGAAGVLLASAVAKKTTDPLSVLEDLRG